MATNAPRRLKRKLLLGAAAVLTCAAMLASVGWFAAAPGARPLGAEGGGAYRILVFTRTAGFRHDSIPDGIAAIRAAAAARDVHVDQTEDPTVFDDTRLAPYRAIVLLSTTGDSWRPISRPPSSALSRPVAASWAFTPPPTPNTTGRGTAA